MYIARCCVEGCMDEEMIVRVEEWMDDMWMNRWMLYNIGIYIKCASVNIFIQRADK